MFRLCENDLYLKKKALNISRLLNMLKDLIVEKGEDIGGMVGAVISLSSVTSLEAFDQPVVDYHKGTLLKEVRSALIPKLKAQLPELPNLRANGRVTGKAYIDLFETDWQRYITLETYNWEGKICLELKSDFYIPEVVGKDFDNAFADAGLTSEIEEIKTLHKNDLNDSSYLNNYELLSKYSWSKGYYNIGYYTWLALPKVDDFYKEEIINELVEIMVKWIKEMDKLTDLSSKLVR